MNHLQIALAWMLIHSLWQSALLMTLGRGLQALFFRKNADTHYNIWVFILMLQIVSCISTFYGYYQPSQPDISPQSPVAFTPITTQQDFNDVRDDPEGTFWMQAAQIIRLCSPYISFVWLIGIMFLTLRFAFAYLQLYKLKTLNSKPENGKWQSKTDEWISKLGMNQTVVLLLSDVVSSPFTTGFLYPIIIFPTALITQLPANQIESLVLHELAHIKRQDYFINILQHCVEILLFFNPFIWMISHQIRTEREHCCDDFVLRCNVHTLSYFHALAATQAFASSWILTANHSQNTLLNRMKRMKNQQVQPTNYGAKLRATLLTLTLILGCVYATHQEKDALLKSFTTLKNQLNRPEDIDIQFIVDGKSYDMGSAENINEWRGKEIEIKLEGVSSHRPYYAKKLEILAKNPYFYEMKMVGGVDWKELQTVAKQGMKIKLDNAYFGNGKTPLEKMTFQLYDFYILDNQNFVKKDSMASMMISMIGIKPDVSKPIEADSVIKDAEGTSIYKNGLLIGHLNDDEPPYKIQTRIAQTPKVALRIDGKVVKTPILLEDSEWDKPFSLSLLNAKTGVHYRYTGIEFLGKKGDAPFQLLGGTMQVEKNEVTLPTSINVKHYYDEIAIEVKGVEILGKDGTWTTLPQSNAYFLIKKK